MARTRIVRGVRIGEARTLLGQVFTARIEAVFAGELAAADLDGRLRYLPRVPRRRGA